MSSVFPQPSHFGPFLLYTQIEYPRGSLAPPFIPYSRTYNYKLNNFHLRDFKGTTVSVIKLARVQYFVTELCQFLGGDCKVIIAVNQRSQTLLALRNKGGELILSKKTLQLKGRGPKKGKKAVFLKNSKIPDCGPTSAARELKKEMNVRT